MSHEAVFDAAPALAEFSALPSRGTGFGAADAKQSVLAKAGSGD